MATTEPGRRTTEPGRRTRPPERVRVVLGDVARQQAARRGGQMRAELEATV